MRTFSEREGINNPKSMGIIYNEAPAWMRLAYFKLIVKPMFEWVYEIGGTSSDEMTDIDCYQFHFAYRSFYEKLCIELCFDPGDPSFVNDHDYFSNSDFIYNLIRNVDWYRFYDIVEYIGHELQEVDKYCIGYWEKEAAYIEMEKAAGITYEDLDIDYELADDYEWKMEERQRFFDEVNFPSYRNQVNDLFIKYRIGWEMNEEGILTRELPADLDEKVNEIQSAIKSEYAAAHEHCRKAKNFLTQRPLDPANSVKEIVTALESLGRTLYPNARTLTGVVQEMRKQDTFPQRLLPIIQDFYSYACDDPGIRHGKPEAPNVSLEDAEFCFHLGAALINYIIIRNKTKGS